MSNAAKCSTSVTTVSVNAISTGKHLSETGKPEFGKYLY